MKFEELLEKNEIYLYLGDIQKQRRDITGKNFIGLSLFYNNDIHIQHDVTKPIPLNRNSVDIIQSEDVMEHIEYSKLKNIINEMYRILKPNGLFRLSMPDYSCDILYKRSIKDINNNIVFDHGGGGNFDLQNKKVINGGHLWFPTYSAVKYLLESTNFLKSKIQYLHYYDENKNPVTKNIDYSLGWIKRTPDHDERVKKPYRPLSIVVDCYK
jgi:predicted SAM-dependent methyltransferase